MYTFQEIQRKDAAQNPEEFLLESLIGKLRAYRIFFGISQRELSRKSGVTQNIISRMENGTYTPKLQTLVKLLSALDLDLEINIKPRDKSDIKLDTEKLESFREKVNQIATENELEELVLSESSSIK